MFFVYCLSIKPIQKIQTINWQILSISYPSYTLASIDNTKKNAVYFADFMFIIIQVSGASGGLHISLLANILVSSSPYGLLTVTGRIY